MLRIAKSWIQDLSKQLNKAFFLVSFLLIISNGEYSRAILILTASFIIKSNRY